MTVLLAAGLGAFGWSLTEYLMHRFDGHGMKGKTRFSKEHLAHHADPKYFAPTVYKLRAAAGVLFVQSLALYPFFGLAGIGFALGFGLAYAGYEWLHRRIHTHAPLGHYGRWARKHHFHHHFNSPKDNHGVTSPVWDIVFGTLVPTGQVRVPRRHAPVWLTDDEGGLIEDFSTDYVLAGRPAR